MMTKQARHQPASETKASQRPKVTKTQTHSLKTPLWAQNKPVQRSGLTVNAPDDAYEQEAETMATQVMRMSTQSVQRRCACGGTASENGECAACKSKRLQRVSDGASSGGQQAPTSVKQTISQSGSPLDSATRSFMETRFGQNFSNVRVHTNNEAAQSAADVDAKAYTVGNNIVFNQGAYQPQSDTGKHLIAHELAHTIQQGATQKQLQRVLCETSEQCPRYERGEVSRSQTSPMQVHIDQSASNFTVIVSNFPVDDPNPKADLATNVQWTTLLSTIGATATGAWDVIGYTDCIGTDTDNATLRQERAEAIATLIRPHARINIVNGEAITNCLADNTSEVNRAKNRAVIIRRTGGSTGPTPPAAPTTPIGATKPAGTPADYCTPYTSSVSDTIQERADMGIIETFLQAAEVRHGLPTASLYRDYINRRKGASLAPRVITDPGIVRAFETDPATIGALATLLGQIRTALRALPEAQMDFSGARYQAPRMGLGTLLPTANLEPAIRYTDPVNRIPGLLAGGAGGRAIQASDAGADIRLFTGDVQITSSRASGSVSRQFDANIRLQVIDAIDFCPGNPGGSTAQIFTIPMSRREATSSLSTYDLPFHVFVNFRFTSEPL